MKKHKRFLASISLILFLLLLLPGNRQIVRAGSEGLAVIITYPSEGETFYAGPDALIYSIQVSGYITGGDNTAPYQVRLEILQGELLYGTQDILTQEDGSFKFFVTANPDGVLRGFVTFERDCPQCHFRSELNFPPGSVLLRVRASSNSGEEALAERNIVIDKSGFKNVNVQIVPAEADGILPPDLDVVASTWLYLWRARSSSGITDEFGKGRVQVEALSEAPTRYVFRLEPKLINGQLFEGVNGVEVILKPDTETIDPVLLQVRSRWGSIEGELAGEILSNPVAVDAIYLTDGQRFTTETSSSGSFRFENVPIGPYLVFANPEALNMQSLAADVQEVDLRPDGAGSVRLKLTTSRQAS
ncbi:MAG: carboxypeptidase-like regulatory domain-containing protein, partial [Chloroflexota bacterium]